MLACRGVVNVPFTCICPMAASQGGHVVRRPNGRITASLSSRISTAALGQTHLRSAEIARVPCLAGAFVGVLPVVQSAPGPRGHWPPGLAHAPCVAPGRPSASGAASPRHPRACSSADRMSGVLPGDVRSASCSSSYAAVVAGIVAAFAPRIDARRATADGPSAMRKRKVLVGVAVHSVR